MIKSLKKPRTKSKAEKKFKNMAVPVLELKHVNKSFPLDTIQVNALKNINLIIKQGELAAIMGPSGSGKSTLMYIMGFLDTPTSGQVIFEGKDVSKLTENQQAAIRNGKIGFIFQMFNLLPRTSALDNVLMPLTYSDENKAVGKDRALKLMERVGISHRISHFSNQMSGGEQQRVAITRAFINNPSLILADEPTGNLDSKTGSGILTILKEFNKEGKTIVVVTHDLEVAKKCDRIIKIKDGQLI